MSVQEKPEISFLQDAITVAQALRGAQLEINGRTAEITDTQGYLREENNTPNFRVVFTRQPADLLVAPFMQHGIPLVIVAEGGCVLIRGGNIVQPGGGIENATKPAVLAKKLGLPRGAVYRLEVVTQQPPLLRATLLSS